MSGETERKMARGACMFGFVLYGLLHIVELFYGDAKTAQPYAHNAFVYYCLIIALKKRQ